jgi:hypothetical protein
MAKTGKWITCESCDTEFRIVSDSFYDVEYCPYCSVELPSDEEESEDGENEE